jgi:preprotein translocase subunit SecE
MALQEQIDKARDVVPRSVTYVQEVWAELKKVHWPSRKEVTAATVVVLVVVLVVAVFLGLVDFGVSRLVQLVLSR